VGKHAPSQAKEGNFGEVFGMNGKEATNVGVLEPLI